MPVFFLNLVIIACLRSFVLSDITSPVNYQPIKYSQVHLEISFVTNDESVRNKFDFTHPHTLITVVNSKKPVYASGRLLVVRSEYPTEQSFNNTGSLSGVYGACSSINRSSDTKWIALVLKSGQCSTKEKLENVFRYTNASAVIIVDDSLPRNGNRYEYQNKIGIHLDEQLLPLHILLNESIFINATIIVNNYYLDGFISRTSVLFVSISFILLMIISLVWLIFYYIRRFQYMNAKERLSRRLENAAKKALDKIPLKILSAYDNEVANDYDQCVICIDNYNIGETIRILPCKHIFHKICIDSWLIEQRSCPMCKVDILKACGVLNVPVIGKARDRGMTSIINQGLWVANATVTATATLVESGLTDESSIMESLRSNSRCRMSNSNFLQRYRERYGFNHCHCRHRLYKRSRQLRGDNRLNTDIKRNPLNLATIAAEESYNNNKSEHERVDLISDSEHSIICHEDTAIRLSLSDDKDSKYRSRQIAKDQELHEISNGLVCDICECSSDNINTEFDVCEGNQTNSNHEASISCSCETCSDCLFVDSGCNEYDPRRSNQASGIGNLLTCCMSSNTNISHLHNNTVIGLYCCNPCARCRTSTCSSCNNKMPPLSLRCQFTSQMKTAYSYSQTNTPPASIRPVIPTRKCVSDNFESVQRLKAIMLLKSINKNGTIDSYNKSSISDDFDYDADNGSSSMELSIPAVKLTVLPPQVQCHQGPITTTDSSHSNEQRSEEFVSENNKDISETEQTNDSHRL